MTKIFLFLFLFFTYSYNYNVYSFSCREWDSACLQRQEEDIKNDEDLNARDNASDAESYDSNWESSKSDSNSDWFETLTDEQMETLDNWWTLISTDSNWNVTTLSNPDSNSNWAWWPGDLTSSEFEINVSDISPWIESKWVTTSEKINWLLWTTIQTMMIALWILSVLIMTIWSWYMILHNWQDELLSKWKSIFMSWVYAMIIALTSYYLIAIIRFLLYNTPSN